MEMSQCSEGILMELERLRKELYGTVQKGTKTLTSPEIYKASITLDKLIVKFLQQKYYAN
ncbi:MAG TPA: aspartyl-phosphate phosphatase Spo0E family protein [Peptococcaceae bacterium]|jgi:hypothetical protein|nr:aspartyl-phosphate phosphatase Spo0E family protein [Peptococcaceae bacterium]HPZ71169.1 aspartyl-phosphate phosphatase Spo0E family protein [Peptococcaceae bacterium]HQD54846.1 aspartyl-phosphate phosphatase Spo0E family protein [Peptococcaceae bacterium]